MEEEAEGYLVDLISSNVVMALKRAYKGKVKYCQVHDVMLHFCLEKSRERKVYAGSEGHDRQFQPLDLKASRVRFSFVEELSMFASMDSKTRKPFHQHLRKISQNDVLDCLTRIKSGRGESSSVNIHELEMSMRLFRTFSKLGDFLDIIRKMAKVIVETLHSVFDDECETNLVLNHSCWNLLKEFFNRKMAENEIEEMLDHLRRIKNGDDLISLKFVLGIFRTFIKYHHLLLPDSIVKLKWTAQRHHWISSWIPDECKTNLNLKRLQSHLLEFFEGNTSLSYSYELNNFDLLEYMDCLGMNLNDLLMMFLKNPPEKDLTVNQLKIVQRKMRFLTYLYATEINGYVDHEKLECLETRIKFMADNVGQLCLSFSVDFLVEFPEDKDEVVANEYEYIYKPPYLLCLIVLVELEMKKIFLSELKASKFNQSRTFKDKKLPKGFSHHLHSLLICLKNKKLENFPNILSAQNIDVAIDFLLVFLDADVSNHVTNNHWLNEVFLKVGAIAGDVLYVIQNASSINKDDISKISLCSIQILEETKDLKAQVETYYKSLKFTPSQFPTFGGLRLLDSLLIKLNEMSRSKSSLDFLVKPLLGNLEKELSSLTPILEKELSSLSSIFRDVAKVHHEHETLKNLQRRTINLVHDAEVAIDSIVVQYNAFLHIFCSFPTILKEIKRVNAEVTEIWSGDVALKRFNAEVTEIAPSKHLPTKHSNPVPDEEMVGFGNDTEKIIQYLIRGTNELDVVPIVGMGGQGKTTIARKVYNSDSIVSHFDVRAWCTVSQTYSRRELLQHVFSQVTGSKKKEDRDDIHADMLRKNLMGKRYLIVLDDMWDGMVWDDLRLCFPDFGIKSRIIVTTRLEEVDKQVKYHTDPYSLPLLTTEESCQLLQKRVFQKEDCPPELQDVSQAVAEKCKGLPLVVVLVAGIIKKRKMEESWWNEVKDALFSYLDRGSDKYSQTTMELSFDNLPDCLKPCLLYMGMFPEDARIPASKLISLWIAEGFVENSESGRLMEEEAEGYLMDLISNNVVIVSKRSYNGKVKYCQVHDAVHHFCLEKSREGKFMLAVTGQYLQFQPLDWNGSRVRFSFSEELSKFASLSSKTQKPLHQHLRSLITTNGGESFHWHPFCQLSELRLLKVLDLSSYSVRFLSSAIFKPINHLKYLAVSANKFHFHPKSHLPHLETLMVMELNDEVVVPASFWEMKKLRHVHFESVVFYLEEDKQGMFEESSKLENLRILRNVIFRIRKADRMDVLLRRCPNLQQLEIIFEDNEDSAVSFCLTLENLPQLQKLQLSFICPHFLSGLQLPSVLKKLVLAGIHIESHISFIAGLPSLEYLCLGNSEYFESQEWWCLEDITFHKLKFLKLVWLDISRWDASEESFPMLETLVIEQCVKLEEIPLSFANIPTLKQIKLIGRWKESLEASVVRIKEEVEAIEGCDRLNLIKEGSAWGN